MFPQLPDRIDYSALEGDIQQYWRNGRVFEKSIESRPADNTWTFYEGPPTANGLPGIHHLFSRGLKDMFCRYKSMRGYRVNRKAGWDTHGLPVEIALEKQLGLKQKNEIETVVGVEKFNRMARELVTNNINRPQGWREFTERIGYWVNLDDPYITFTNDYIESVWWAISELYGKGLIYRGFRIVPQCPHCETPLSSHELSLGYEEVRDPSLFVKVRLVEGATTRSGVAIPDGAAFLVWTTTPWTLISNVALAVGPDIDYSISRLPESGEHYIHASARASALDPDGTWEKVAEVKGSELEGIHYQRLFDYVPVDRDAFYVVAGSFVSTEDGTGIVHIAPAFGQDDYEISKRYNLPLMQPVTPGGRFTDVVTDWAGRPVKTLNFDGETEEGVDREIVNALKERGLVHKFSRDYLHSYPHCWRCENPLIYYARDSWYIRTTEYSPEMIAGNDRINWQPAEIGAGRFGNWLEENKDWSLSRDRYWGTPLPIWINEEDRDDMFVVGSIEELMKGELVREDGSTVAMAESGVELDLHKPYVDSVIFRRDGKTYRRTSELIDVWFDSGSMPFAQWHYPFENREKFAANFPADFIAEGIDQTRGWFYTLHAISTPLFGSPAAKVILVNDMVLDEKGQKMSKSRGNVVEPFTVLDRYGADATRWYMITNSPPWKPTSFSETDLAKTAIGNFFNTLTNTYSFFALYANIDGFTHMEPDVPAERRQELDRWILSSLNSLVAEYTRLMDGYDPTRAMRLVAEFTTDQLSNWYVRRNRRRFWKDALTEDKLAAYQTLYECLTTVTKLMAPLAPFLSEHLFRSLNNTTGREPAESVHLALIPDVAAGLIDRDLERRMERAQRVIGLARGLREAARLKVRQPLRRILIPYSSAGELADLKLVEEILKEELNIRSVEYVDAERSSDVVRRKAKANFRVIGPKFGKQVKTVSAAIAAMTGLEIATLLGEGALTLRTGSDTFDLLPEDVEIIYEDIAGWLVASEGAITVALDTELDDSLLAEGMIREFVFRVQNLRKDSGLEVTDRIRLVYDADGALEDALEQNREFIMLETLATAFSPGKADQMIEVDINGRACRLALEKDGAIEQ
jgi:isoleucyl-tRNA synthetase